jgi:hypothetical protein
LSRKIIILGPLKQHLHTLHNPYLIKIQPE